jgi:hypothetical protein
MTKELQNKLFEKYPELFVQKGLSPSESPMAWGITCGDGWYDIIDTLCHRIVSYTKNKSKHLTSEANNVGEIVVEVVQVKEKFGTLRFYISEGDDVIYELINFAEEMSAVTCEVCGSPGVMRNRGWMQTLCDAHDKQ